MHSRLFVMLLCVLGLAGAHSAIARPHASPLDSTDRVTYEYTGPGVFFGNGATSVGVEIEVPDLFEIYDVDVTVHIDHTWVGDVGLSLISPDNTTVVLMEDIGGPNQNIHNTTFNDDAAVSITNGNAPFTGSFRPMDELSRFNGESGTGTWTLLLQDDFPSSDDGTLNWWHLTIAGRIGSSVQGRVVSLANGDPLEGVEIRLADSEYTTLTNVLGEYELFARPGVYNLLVSYPNWCSQLMPDLELVEEDTLQIDIDLAKPEANVTRSSVNVLAHADSIVVREIGLLNSGNCELEWSVNESADWLEIAALNGSVAAESTIEVMLTFDATGLSVGDYYTTLEFVHNAELSPIHVPVYFAVTDQILATYDVAALPGVLKMYGSYPNPFNAVTTLRFALPRTTDVRVELYSIHGRLVETLFDGKREAGFHELPVDGAGLASGTYLAQVTAAGSVSTSKLLLLK